MNNGIITPDKRLKFVDVVVIEGADDVLLPQIEMRAKSEVN